MLAYLRIYANNKVMFAALRHQRFRRLFMAHVVALLGTGLATIAIGFLAVDIAGGNASGVIGTILAIKMVTYLLVGPVAPVIAQRFRVRRLLVTTDLLRAGVALALPFVDSVATAYLLIVVLQAASALFTPTFQATIPTVLDDEREYTGALALSRLAYDLEALASPSIAGILLFVLPSSMLFFGTSAGFIGSGLLILSVVIPHTRPREAAPVRTELTEGIRIMLRVPVLRASLFLQLSVAAAGPVVTVLTVPLARTHLGLSESESAGLLASFGLGSITAAILMPWLIERVGLRSFILRGVIVLTAPLTLLWPVLILDIPTHLTMLLIGVLWFVSGTGYSAVIAPMGRIIRANTSADEMPAAFAGQFSLAHGWWIATYSLVGWGATAIGYGPISLVMVTIALIALGLATHWWPRSEVHQGELEQHLSNSKNRSASESDTDDREERHG